MTTTEDILTFFKPYNITIYETLTEKNNISSISVSGGICEITTATSHTAIVGQYVYITLGKNAGYHEITAVSSTTIRYLDDSGVASGAIGEVYIYSINEHMINDAIQSAKDNIEAITQIPIGRVDELSTYHDGTNTEELFLNHRGIRELISIQIIQGMILNYIIDISSVFLIAEEGVLRIKQLTSVSIGTIRAVFPQGRRNIKVTFRIGYELNELPARLYNALRLFTGSELIIKKQGLQGNISSFSIQGYSEGLATPGLTSTIQQLKAQAMRELKGYVSHVVGD